MIAAVLVAVAVAFGLFRLRQGGFRWSVFAATLESIDPAWFLIATGLMLLTYVVRALRWRIMLRPLLEHPHIWRIISATIIGFTAVTLFGRPGELVRPYLIANREKVPFSSQLAAWLLERIYDLLMVLLIFGYALAHLPSERSELGPALEWTIRTGGYLAALIGVVCVVILVAANQFSEATRRRLTDALGFLPPHLHKKAEDLVHAFTTGVSCTRNARHAWLLVGWSVVEWFIIIASTRCLFRSFPTTSSMGWIEVMIFIGFVAFGSVIQIPGIGGGLQVAAVLVLTRLFGLSLEAATGVAILFWFLSFVLIVPIGLALMLVEGVKLKALREISEAELDEQPTAP